MNYHLEAAQRLAAMAKLVAKVPAEVYFSVNGSDEDLSLSLQAHTQADVQAIRACFPGTFWSKSYSELSAWWDYDTVIDGVPVNIYAVREAPPTCKLIETEIETTEEVPTKFETRTVKKVVQKWECGNEYA